MMKNLFKKISKPKHNRSKHNSRIALIMSLVMVVTLIPFAPFAPTGVEAATGNLTIDYPGGLGTDTSNAIQVSERNFRLTGSFTGFAISSISYTVRNLGSGHTEVGGTPYNPPATNNYVYDNIILTPGVNEITVQTAAGLNRKIFVEFNDMPGIFNLTINGQDLIHDELVINASVIQGQAIAGAITGLATNATAVDITNQTIIATNANASISAQVFGATGMFTGTLPLVAGENRITFIAKNETKSVTEERRIIVNALTAGAGLNVYNLQSHYGPLASAIIKNIPKDGQVDLIDNDPNNNNNKLNAKDTYGSNANDLQFTGRIITNVGGAGYLELNKFYTIGTGANVIRVHSDIQFDVQKMDGTSIIGGAKSLLTDSDIATQSKNPMSIIATDKAVFDFAKKLSDVRTMARAIANVSVPADITQVIDAANYNILNTNSSIEVGAADVNTLLQAANTSLSAIGISTPVTAHPMGSAQSLQTAASALYTHIAGITAGTTTWDTMFGGQTLASLVTALKTAAAAYISAADALDNAGSPTVIQSKYTEIVNLAKVNNAISKDETESTNNTHFYDFVTSKLNAATMGLTHNQKYKIVITPKYYKANPVSANDYANFNPLVYEFTYIDSKYPRITSVQNANSGEIIYNVSPPSTNYYRVSQRPFKLRVNFENFVNGQNIIVYHKAAPYPADLSSNTAILDGNITKQIGPTDVNNKYIDVDLQNLLPGNNMIEIRYTNGTQTVIERRVVLVVTTPLVTLRNATLDEEIANNKVFNFTFDPSIPNEDEKWFMEQHFGNVSINFSGLSDINPLGSSTNPIFISLNDVQINPTGITTATAINSVILERSGSPISKVRLNLTKFLDGTNKDYFRQGLNTIKVEFKNGNNPSKLEIQFYLFTESAPEVTNVRVVDHALPSNQEKQIVDFNPYITNGDEISLKATIKNSDKVVLRIQGVDVIEYKLNNDGTQWVLQSTQLPTGSVTITPPVGNYKESELTIHNYKLVNPSENVLQGSFVFVVDVSYKHTSTNRPITIMKKVEPYTVLAPYRQVVNNNYQKVIIKSDSAVSVKIGKDEAQRIRISDNDVMSKYVADWLVSHLYGSNQGLYNSLGTDGEVFFAEVPLKKGNNKIQINVDFGSQQINGQMEIYYAATPQTGAVYKADMIKNSKIRVADWGNAIELNFPKGTLLRKKDMKLYGEYERYDEYYDIPSFWADKQILIGIADYETGKVDRDIAKSTRADLRMSLNNSYYNNYFQYSSPLYFIDAGDLQHPGGRLPYESPEIVTRKIEDALEPTNRGTITIAYNPSIVMDAGPHLAVMYNPGYTSIGSNAGWKNLGGVVDTKKNTITVPFEGFGYYTVMKLNRSLSDIIFHPWGRRNLEAMFSKGIMITEPGTNRFGTDLNITRGEFTTMLIKALQIPINAGPYMRQGTVLRPVNSSFDDIMPGMGDFFWNYEYLETAARAGIIQGKAPGLFMPNEQLTREQAAVIIARAIEAKLARTPEIAMQQLTKDFTDATNVDTYARQAVAAIAKTGIVIGKQNDPDDPTRGFSFLPKNNLTRAEASVIATRLMQKQKLLPDPL